ncbi:hypothetical protein BJX96DRAFT_74426 [Aspergillus floccosus]
MLFCPCNDRSRNATVERLETEKPRLVQVRTSTGECHPGKRVSLPERVQSQMSMRESFGNYKRTSVESSRFREITESYKSSLRSKTARFPIRGIMRSPTRKSLSESTTSPIRWADRRPSHIWANPSDARLAAKLRRDIDLDNDPAIVIEEVDMDKGDVVVIGRPANSSESDTD